MQEAVRAGFVTVARGEGRVWVQPWLGLLVFHGWEQWSSCVGRGWVAGNGGAFGALAWVVRSERWAMSYIHSRAVREDGKHQS